jgi:hypothetical protein
VGEIKSAWEIALEKTESLGRLSADELRQQEEERCRLVGTTLTDKYLTGLGLRQLEIELDKYRPKERELIEKAIASQLVQLIELGNYSRLEKAIEGIAYFKPDETIQEVAEEIRQLFDEHQAAEQRERKEIEKSAWEILHRMRIAGSAVGEINPQARPEWQKRLAEISQPYREKLENLKEKLSEPYHFLSQ